MSGDVIIVELGKPVTGVTRLIDNALTCYKSRYNPVTDLLHSRSRVRDRLHLTLANHLTPAPTKTGSGSKNKFGKWFE